MEDTFVSFSGYLKITTKVELPFICFYLNNHPSHFYDFYLDDWEDIQDHFSQKSWVSPKLVKFINSIKK
jgi:hypothetical protein